MDGVRESYLLWAKLLGPGGLQLGLNDTQAGHPAERCLHRMERVAAAHQGRILHREPASLAAAFDSADAAVAAACDMRSRCDELPPVSGAKLPVRIGIHRGPARQRAGDTPGEAENIARDLARALPAPGIAISAQVREALGARFLPRTSTLAVDVPGTVAYAVDAVAEGAAPPPPPVRALVAPVLALRYGDETLEIRADQTSVGLGRQSDNDLVVHHDLASRHHLRIERRGEAFLLTDLSTNGTYLAPEGEPEVLVKGVQAVLKSRGRIGLGHPVRKYPERSVAYEVLRG